MDLPGRMRVTGAYVSPNFSGSAMTNLLNSVIRNGTGRDWIIVDLNDRDNSWDTESNARGREIKTRIAGKRNRVLAPQAETFKARRCRALSTPYIVKFSTMFHEVY